MQTNMELEGNEQKDLLSKTQCELKNHANKKGKNKVC